MDDDGVGQRPKHMHELTLIDLLAAINLGHLFFDQLVTLLADCNDLLSRNTELGDLC